MLNIGAQRVNLSKRKGFADLLFYLTKGSEILSGMTIDNKKETSSDENMERKQIAWL